MSSINNVLNSPNWSIQVNNQTVSTQTQPRIHHHHHKSNSQDSVEISEDGSQASDNRQKSPLYSLVANGTITQDQEDSIRSAFISARQVNQSGTYSSSQSNPLSSLVANNTITQAQANSITNAFKSRFQQNNDNNQIVGSQSQNRILQNIESQDSLTQNQENV